MEGEEYMTTDWFPACAVSNFSTLAASVLGDNHQDQLPSNSWEFFFLVANILFC